MHTKSELEKMSLEELSALAQSVNAEPANDPTILIYNIIDAEAMAGSNRQNSTNAKPKRSSAGSGDKAAKDAASADKTPKKRGRKPKAEAMKASEEGAAEAQRQQAAPRSRPRRPRRLMQKPHRASSHLTRTRQKHPWHPLPRKGEDHAR